MIFEVVVQGWWQSYRFESYESRKELSIAKDELALLEERLAFFLPNFDRLFTSKEVITYIAVWSLFLASLRINSISNWPSFLAVYGFEISATFLTVIPAAFLAQIQRESLKALRPVWACVRLVATAVLVGALAMFFLLVIVSFLGWTDFTLKELVYDTLVHMLNTAGFTSAYLIYCLHRYRELNVMYASFEQRLATQNDHIRARLAPHFFFNTINTLSTLVDIDSNKAGDLLHHVSMLFRSSFSDPSETSFDEELELCRHYLSIEKYRLQDKLIIHWNLPDEDVLYDMTITSLTLQSVLEQTVLHVIELATNQVALNITVSWENHMATITVSAVLPSETLLVDHHIQNLLQFDIQQRQLQSHFGKEAIIHTKTSTDRVVTVIGYPLYDAYLSDI